MIRGYSGYYNGIYLRSALEFAFAYYLDSKGIKWEYEKHFYDIGGEHYKPDFFIIGDRSEILEIAEIKGKKNRADGEYKISKFKRIYSVPITLIDYKILLEIYKQHMPIRLNRAIKMFKEEYKATLKDQYMMGENNPMYGIKHRSSTKKLIGEKAKQRFNDEEYMKLFKESLKSRVPTKGYIKSKRVTKNCPICDSSFVVTEFSDRVYCSSKCGSLSSVEIARKANENRKNKLRTEVRDYMINWVKNNKDQVIMTPYNRITQLSELFDSLSEKYEIKDMRTIAFVFGCSGRKELLKKLKQIAIE